MCLTCQLRNETSRVREKQSILSNCWRWGATLRGIDTSEFGLNDDQYRQLRRELIAHYGRTVGPDQAADLVDEAITISLTSAYDPERGHREAWISGIARNLHANDWKRRGRRPTLPPPERYEEGQDDLVLDRLEACALLAAVAVAMAELPAGDPAVLAAAAAAAAALTEVTPGARTNAQYVRLHRARARLRGVIG